MQDETMIKLELRKHAGLVDYIHGRFPFEERISVSLIVAQLRALGLPSYRLVEASGSSKNLREFFENCRESFQKQCKDTVGLDKDPKRLGPKNEVFFFITQAGSDSFADGFDHENI